MQKNIRRVVLTLCLLLSVLACVISASALEAEVYVASTGNDTNAGTSDAPVATLAKAYELLGTTGGTIKIVDTVNIVGNKNTTCFLEPAHTGKITITSADLDNKGALAFVSGTGTHFHFNGEAEWNNIKVTANHTGGNVISCEGNKVTLGEGLVMEATGTAGTNGGHTFAGTKLYVLATAQRCSNITHPSKLVGDLTILSGDYWYISAGRIGTPTYTGGSARIYVGTEDADNPIWSRYLCAGCLGSDTSGYVGKKDADGNAPHMTMIVGNNFNTPVVYRLSQGNFSGDVVVDWILKGKLYGSSTAKTSGSFTPVDTVNCTVNVYADLSDTAVASQTATFVKDWSSTYKGDNEGDKTLLDYCTANGHDFSVADATSGLICAICDGAICTYEGHAYKNGTCTYCNYTCTHTDGKVTIALNAEKTGITYTTDCCGTVLHTDTTVGTDIYVSSTGTTIAADSTITADIGLTSATAFGKFEDAMAYAAAVATAKDAATVHIVDSAAVPANYATKEFTGTITITGDTVGVMKFNTAPRRFYANGDVTFKNLTFTTNVENGVRFFAQNHAMVFDEGIVMGNATTLDGGTGYPKVNSVKMYVHGGFENGTPGVEMDTNLTVRSGDYWFIGGWNLSSNGTASGNSKITLGKKNQNDYFYAKHLVGFSTGVQNLSEASKATIVIDGAFACHLFYPNSQNNLSAASDILHETDLVLKGGLNYIAQKDAEGTVTLNVADVTRAVNVSNIKINVYVDERSTEAINTSYLFLGGDPTGTVKQDSTIPAVNMDMTRYTYEQYCYTYLDGHTGLDADGKCDECGFDKTSCTHSRGWTKTNEKAPTCNAYGTYDKLCNECSNVFETAVESTEGGYDANNHACSFAGTAWVYDAETAKYTYACPGCSTVLETADTPYFYVDTVDGADAAVTKDFVGDDTYRGTSAETAVKTLNEAVTRLAKTGGTVYLCDRYPVTISNGINLPPYEKTITFSSTKSAAGTLQTGFVIKNHGAVINLNGPTKFEDIIFNGNSSVQNNSDKGYYRIPVICANWNNVEFAGKISTFGAAFFVAGRNNPTENCDVKKDIELIFNKAIEQSLTAAPEGSRDSVTFFSKVFLGDRSRSDADSGISLTVSNKTVTAEFNNTTVGDLYLATASEFNAGDGMMTGCTTTVDFNDSASIQYIRTGAANTTNGAAVLDTLAINFNDNSLVTKQCLLYNVKHISVSFSGDEDGRTEGIPIQFMASRSKTYVVTDDETASITYTSHSFTTDTKAPAFNAMYGDKASFTTYTDDCEWGETVIVAPVCGVNGSKTQTCSECEATKTEVLTPEYSEHKYVNGVCEYCEAACDHPEASRKTDSTASTCSTHGTEKVTCGICGFIVTEHELDLDPNNHEKLILQQGEESYSLLCEACENAIEGTTGNPEMYVNYDSGSDANTGFTAETAVQSLEAAVQRLSKTGGTVMLCADYPLREDTPLPEYTEVITFSSVTEKVNNIDQPQYGFKTTSHNITFTLNGPTKFENIIFNGTRDTVNEDTKRYYNILVIVADWNNVTFAGRINTFGGAYFVAGRNEPTTDEATPMEVNLTFNRTFAGQVQYTAAGKTTAYTFFEKIFLGDRLDEVDAEITVSNKTVKAIFNDTTMIDLYLCTASKNASSGMMSNCETYVTFNKINARVNNLHTGDKNTSEGEAVLDKLEISCAGSVLFTVSSKLYNVKDLTVTFASGRRYLAEGNNESKAIKIPFEATFSENYAGGDATASVTCYSHTFNRSVEDPVKLDEKYANPTVTWKDECSWVYDAPEYTACGEEGIQKGICSVCDATASVVVAPLVGSHVSVVQANGTYICERCKTPFDTLETGNAPVVISAAYAFVSNGKLELRVTVSGTDFWGTQFTLPTPDGFTLESVDASALKGTGFAYSGGKASHSVTRSVTTEDQTITEGNVQNGDLEAVLVFHYTVAETDGESFSFIPVAVESTNADLELLDTLCVGANVTLTCAHNWEEQVTLKPTTTAEGSKTCTCKICQATEVRSIPKLGDIDGSGTVNIEDVLLLIYATLNDTPCESGDINGDGNLGLIDVILAINLITA